jgi:hypothetical protein
MHSLHAAGSVHLGQLISVPLSGNAIRIVLRIGSIIVAKLHEYSITRLHSQQEALPETFFPVSTAGTPAFVFVVDMNLCRVKHRDEFRAVSSGSDFPRTGTRIHERISHKEKSRVLRDRCNLLFTENRRQSWVPVTAKNPDRIGIVSDRLGVCFLGQALGDGEPHGIVNGIALEIAAVVFPEMHIGCFCGTVQTPPGRTHRIRQRAIEQDYFTGGKTSLQDA